MQNDEPLITITQYSMTTARGMILQSIPFDSIEHALNFPPLCARTKSIVIENNKAGTNAVYNPDFANSQLQLEQKLKELFPDDFHKT